MCKCNDCKRTTPQRLYTPSNDAVYKIVRYKQNGNPRTIRSNVTLAEAQAHCNDPKTSGKNWFDGYTRM